MIPDYGRIFVVSYGDIGRKRSYTVEFTVDGTATRMFRRVFVVHDHILRGRYGVVFGRIRTVFCYKTAVLYRNEPF